MRKPLSMHKLKKKLESYVKLEVKQRDSYICQKCGKSLETRNCHASHVYSVGSTPQLQFDPLNMKTLCYFCHFNWWHKNPFEASEWFEEKFPDRFEYLQEARMQVKTYTRPILEEMIDQYKFKTKKYEA
jgi:hypothetical protein